MHTGMYVCMPVRMPVPACGTVFLAVGDVCAGRRDRVSHVTVTEGHEVVI